MKNPAKEGPMLRRSDSSRWFALWLVMLGSSLLGCQSGDRPTPKSKTPTRKTIGKTTQNVLELAEAVAAGGIPASMEITGTGLEVAADAYRTSVGKLAVMAVEQRMSLYLAQHGEKPEGYSGFIEEIIRPGQPNGLHLPMLPYYQEYAYDPASEKLVVIEFPKKKNTD